MEDHIQVVREKAFHMKKALDQSNLRDALKFSSMMLGELKTSKLSPRNYFNLCKLLFLGNSPKEMKIFANVSLLFHHRYDGL